MTHQYSKYPLQKEKSCQSSRSNRTSLWDTYLDSERFHNNRVTANYVALHQLVHCQMFRLPGKKKRLTDSCCKWWCFLTPTFSLNTFFNICSRWCQKVFGSIFQGMWNGSSICSSLFCAVSVWKQLLLLSCASRKLCSKVACLAEHGEDGDMQGLPSMLGATARISLSPFKKKV